jgi:hypothetical protein
MGVAIFLDLPIAAFAGMRCLCGTTLTADNGACHCELCSRHEKSTRSKELNAHFAERVVATLPGSVWIRGAATGSAPCLGVRRERHANGTPQLVSVFPDLNFGGILGDAPSMQYHGDTHLLCASAAAYLPAAAHTPLAAAEQGHQTKLNWYSWPLGLIPAGHRLMPIVAELHGGLHPSVVEQMSQWAHISPGGSAAALPLRVGMIMRVWRVSMSVALLLVRVSAMEAAIRKLEEGRRAEELVGNDRQVKHKSAYQIFRRRSQLEFCAAIPRASAGVCVW